MKASLVSRLRIRPCLWHDFLIKVAPLSAAMLFAGCAAPLDHFHTLRPLATHEANHSEDPTWILSVGPVGVPDALARDEWVIRNGESGALVYDHQLWTQGLGADVAQALSDYLNQAQLPERVWAYPTLSGDGSASSATDQQYSDGPPALRLRMKVVRFDSILLPSPAISDQVAWSLECKARSSASSEEDQSDYVVIMSAIRDVATADLRAVAEGAVGQERFEIIARSHSTAIRLVAVDVARALSETSTKRAELCVQPKASHV